MADQKNLIPLNITKQARIISYDINSGTATIRLANSISLRNPPEYKIRIPVSYSSNNGIFAGGLVAPNTPIIVAMGEGGQYHFISFLITSPKALPSLSENSYLISTNSNTFIKLDTNSNIDIGSKNNFIHLNTNNYSLTTLIDQQNSFSESFRKVSGVVKRELEPAKDFSDYLKLTSDDYEKYLSLICLDPTAAHSINSSGIVKNPAFVENRELIYEFESSADVLDDVSESFLYKKSQSLTSEKLYPNRRLSRSDTLSLSLVAPNYLIETIKGTVVDIFGNLLDINRNLIPVGKKDATLQSNDGNQEKDGSFLRIKELERKGIAFHFEINSRKDLSIKQNGETTNLIQLPDVNSSLDYARQRSRFYIDIDKEGLFKINVPSSSETGNIPLLLRYENYSTYYNNQGENDPNKLIFNNDNKDIYHDSFAIGDIDIKDGDGNFVTPFDRLTNQHIKLGTPFHSIKNSLNFFQPGTESFRDYQYKKHADITSIKTIENVVKPIITVSGTNANAGGRSGNLHLDGSIQFSIGANTSDRQSVVLDTAGGIIGNIGKDDNNISMGLSLDGDLLIQIGGVPGVSNDSRFENDYQAKNYYYGALDIRVIHEGLKLSIIRIDKNGINIVSPTSISIKGRSLTLAAEKDLILEGDNVYINNRWVDKSRIKSI